MARRKSDAEVGTLGVWAYNTRDALDLSVEEAVAALPTTYHPATLRKVEGGSARPGTRMWRELGSLYARIAAEKGIDLEPQPRLRPEPLETTETPDTLVGALAIQTAAINGLVAKLDLLAEAVAELLAERVREASSQSSSHAGSR